MLINLISYIFSFLPSLTHLLIRFDICIEIDLIEDEFKKDKKKN